MFEHQVSYGGFAARSRWIWGRNLTLLLVVGGFGDLVQQVKQDRAGGQHPAESTSSNIAGGTGEAKEQWAECILHA